MRRDEIISNLAQARIAELEARIETLERQLDTEAGWTANDLERERHLKAKNEKLSALIIEQERQYATERKAAEAKLAEAEAALEQIAAGGHGWNYREIARVALRSLREES